jgi:hypothetical protein
MKVRVIAALLTGLLVSSCFEGANPSCTSYCFSLDGMEHDDAAQVDAKIKAVCAKMGKSGAPKILEKSKDTVAGQCT